jgi:eIF3 subunit 6 N terminal domain
MWSSACQTDRRCLGIRDLESSHGKMVLPSSVRRWRDCLVETVGDDGKPLTWSLVVVVVKTTQPYMSIILQQTTNMNQSSTTTAPPQPEAAASPEQPWDLTSRIAPYLDRHMIFPLLDYIEKQTTQTQQTQTTQSSSESSSDSRTTLYNVQDIMEARLALLRPTHMMDYAMDVYTSIQQLHSNDSNSNNNTTLLAELEREKEAVLQNLELLRSKCAPLDTIPAAERVRVSCVYCIGCCEILVL